MSTPIYAWPSLALAFILEMTALGSLAVWGLHAGHRTSSSLALAVGAPLAAALMWGLFASPRAPFHGPVLTPMVTVIFFASAALALYVSGHPRLATGFVVAVVINTLLLQTMSTNTNPPERANGSTRADASTPQPARFEPRDADNKRN